MKNINITQAILIGVSIVAILTAVVMFSVSRGPNSGSNGEMALIWGTISEDLFNQVALELESEKDLNLRYVEKNPATIEDELLRAMAEGTGPDLVLLNEKKIISNQSRLTLVPFESFPLRNFQDLFIDEASLLITKQGFVGFPFLIDPLVMYYNKDLLANAGFSKPPQVWLEVLATAPELTQKDSSFNISQSTIALGSIDNIKNAKEIYWMLVLQSGNPVIVRSSENQDRVEKYTSIFTENLNYTLNPVYAATNFFTQFSNPTKTVYSWNKSLPNSQTLFTSGDLVFYIGKASERAAIQKLNPNLNFDMALVPQSQSSERKITYGEMYTFVIPKTTLNIEGSMRTIAKLTTKDFQTAYANALGVAPVRRDLLAVSDPTNPYQQIIHKSAIMAQGILEPDESKTSAIIKELVDTLVSGQYEVSEAIRRADEKIKLLLGYE